MKIIVAAALAALSFIAAPAAGADPAPTCDAPGLPACANGVPALPPDLICAAIAAQTWMPCNMWGFKVPEGTPGSL